MEIQVSASTGLGPSRITSFDSALANVGLANYNVVEYSSVLPAGSQINTVENIDVTAEFGSPVGCVVAKGFSRPEAEEESRAELAWCQDDSGKGWMIEGNGRVVQPREIEKMNSNREDLDLGSPTKLVESNQNESELWSCSIVLAFYGEIDVKY